MVVVEGKIKAKARPRFNTKSGRAFTPKDTINYENWVRWCYREQCNRFFEGYLRATIFVYHSIPKSYSKAKVSKIKAGELYPDKKPDLDNIAKIILDSLNGIAYNDDKQIIELSVIKRYTEDKERVEFEINNIRGW